MHSNKGTVLPNKQVWAYVLKENPYPVHKLPIKFVYESFKSSEFFAKHYFSLNIWQRKANFVQDKEKAKEAVEAKKKI